MMALLDVAGIFEGGAELEELCHRSPKISFLSCCDKIPQPKGFEEVRVYFGLQL